MLMDVFVRTLTGAGFEFIVPMRETAGMLKLRIQRTQGIPVWQQHIIFQSNELYNDHNLHACGVRDGDILQLILSVQVGNRRTQHDPRLERRPGIVRRNEYLEDACASRDGASNHHGLTLLVYREGEQVEQVEVIHAGSSTAAPLAPVSRLLSCGTNVDLLSHPSEVCGRSGSHSGSNKAEDCDPVRVLEHENTKKKVSELLEKMAARRRRRVTAQTQDARPSACGKVGVIAGGLAGPPMAKLKCPLCDSDMRPGMDSLCRCGSRFCHAHQKAGSHDRFLNDDTADPESM